LEHDERALVRSLQNGEPEAFHTLVDRYGARLFSAACALVGNATDAEDVVQETLAGAIKAAKNFRGEASLKTWLLRILMRQAASLRRSRKKWRLIPTEDPDSPEETSYDGGTTPGPTAAVDSRLDVTEMLKTLSPEHREVIVLRELEGLSYDEMAQAMGVPQGTVESRLFRARQELKRRFERY
jgi:RNA polymerase sigma-70 factor (ECF subfamily)